MGRTVQDWYAMRARRKRGTIFVPVTVEWDPLLSWEEVWSNCKLVPLLLYSSRCKVRVKRPTKAQIRDLISVVDSSQLSRDTAVVAPPGTPLRGKIPKWARYNGEFGCGNRYDGGDGGGGYGREDGFGAGRGDAGKYGYGTVYGGGLGSLNGYGEPYGCGGDGFGDVDVYGFGGRGGYGHDLGFGNGYGYSSGKNEGVEVVR